MNKYRIVYQEEKEGEWKQIDMYASSEKRVKEAFNRSVSIKNLEDCYDYAVIKMEE